MRSSFVFQNNFRLYLANSLKEFGVPIEEFLDSRSIVYFGIQFNIFFIKVNILNFRCSIFRNLTEI